MFLRHKSKSSQIAVSTNKQNEKQLREFDNYLIQLIASYLTLKDAIKFSETNHRHHDLATPLPYTRIIRDKYRRYAVTGTFAELKKFFAEDSVNKTNIDLAKKNARHETMKMTGMAGVIFLSCVTVLTLSPVLGIVPESGARFAIFLINEPRQCYLKHKGRRKAAKADLARLRGNPDQDPEEASVVITKLGR